MTAVRQFTDAELLSRVEHYGGTIPNQGKYLVIGVQSQEDNYNVFDDKFYVYDGPKFVMVTTGTTNPGANALMNFESVNKLGAAIWRTNQFIKDCFIPGYHKKKMKALRQNRPIYFYRDNNKDEKVDEFGKIYYEIIYAHLHGVDYDFFSNKVLTNINGWSYACQVINRMSDYRKLINAAWSRNKTVDYALLKEF